VKVDRIIRWLMPREERFHVLLEHDTLNLLQAGRVFAEVALCTSLETRKVKAVELKAIEHAGDQITRDIFEALNSTFITPFDREDIRSIAMDLDDVLDSLEGVAQHLVLFELAESEEALRQFANILLDMAEQIHTAMSLVWDLANERGIHAAIVRISELENQADTLYAAVIASLFKLDGRNPIEIMKWKVVYDGLEEACDLGKNFTHILGNVVVKNA
jgi:predicted phosphate transport protein (TIGR00153 family)